MTTPNADSVPAGLLRRALKNHDAIAAALRTGVGGPRLFKAIDDMRALKDEAAALGCYPRPIDGGDDAGQHEHVYRCQDCGEIGRAPIDGSGATDA